MVTRKAALQPVNFLNQNPVPSKKKPIKNSDKERLAIIHEKIRIFSLLDQEIQLFNLKTHFIDIGGQRRNMFLNSNIDYLNFSDLSDDE